MIEERIAERFRAAVADEPPLGFDPDEVVTGAARRRRRRLAVTGSALATGGVVVAATAVLATGGAVPGWLVGPAQQPVGQSCVPAPCPPSGTQESGGAPESPSAPVLDKEGKPQPPTVEPSFPGSDAVVAQLGQIIPAVLADRITGLAFTVPDGGGLSVVADRREVGGAYLATGTTHRYVSVWVTHTESDRLDLAADPAAGGGWGPLVSDEVRPDGSHLRVYRWDTDGAKGLSVVHLRVDGVIVHANTTAKPEPRRTGLAVSQEVLTAIATDPRLTF